MKRRDFITMVAATTGSVVAATKTLETLVGEPAVARKEGPPKGPLELPPRGNGTRVIILGAGLAGMASAYEMGKAGYDCRILEAQSRSGGRCWTLRGGDKFTNTDGQTQTAEFDEGLYFNPGPARIPYHHVTIDYCKELGVPIEPILNYSRQQYYYRENAGPLSGQKVHAREARVDMTGYISELLAKSINQGALNEGLSGEDVERIIEFLRVDGDLNPDLVYTGSGRRGYTVLEGAGDQPGEIAEPYDLSALLRLGFANDSVFEWGFDQQMTMFEPVGGVDRIAKAFEKEVGDRITFDAEVQAIRKRPEGVRIVYTDRSGNQQEAVGDYCICTIPLKVLRSIDSDFSPEMKAAIAAVDYSVTGKSGLQFNRRFWEEDEDIFGGITTTDQSINQIWYPSYGYLSNKGVLLGYYNFGDTAAEVGNRSPQERVSLAVKQGSQIHPQYQDHFENGVSVFWPKIPYNLGGWATYTSEVREQYYPRLNEPDGNIYLAGEHLSYQTGWMAGALNSARLVSTKINERV